MSAGILEASLDGVAVPANRPRRVLLIAYNFPPVGGAGVQRPAKWAKYLRRCGWDVTVLTTENPSVPVRDESLLADLPDDVRIVRARTWEPDYRVKQSLVGAASTKRGLLTRIKSVVKSLAKRVVKLALQPDPQVLWNPNALRAGAAALREQPHDAILVTAPAYSSFFIGAALKKQFGLPLILDYRDEWDLSGKYLENAQRDWFSRTVQRRMQRRLLRQADAVVATTQASTSNLATKLADLKHSIPAVCIYNGFDAEDFVERLRVDGRELMVREDASASSSSPSTLDPQPSTLFRLVYAGTLWNLTDIQPLIRAIESLNSSRPELVRGLELVCVGRKTPEQQQVLERVRATTAKLEAIDYCAHSEVVERLNSADGVCLLLSDVPGAERVVPAKLFEYLAIRKEMLTIAPRGETADIARRFFPQGHFVPNDTAGITAWLTERLSGVERTSRERPARQAMDEFSRESQTARLAELLDEVTTRCRR